MDKKEFSRLPKQARMLQQRRFCYISKKLKLNAFILGLVNCPLNIYSGNQYKAERLSSSS